MLTNLIIKISGKHAKENLAILEFLKILIMLCFVLSVGFYFIFLVITSPEFIEILTAVKGLFR